ncbi:subtilisin-like protein [Mytilinidion resinicola]|uniref:Subtilisin-like protein n=1 Tax=Mytilinidion resinicola TaxID=574789 RepID=A0A6A6YDM5_9PEZI|nr:subtilisin-like protein [Mytilinidion resinicola]KAF2806830.1 subtilisin-like protein [Mytilinidion resinicola]
MPLSFSTTALLAALTSTVIAAPTPEAGAGFISNVTPGAHQTGGDEYVVIFNNSQAKVPHVAEVLSRIQLNVEHSDVRWTFNNSVFRGFAANMKSHCIDALNAMEDVAHVEKAVEISSYDTRSGATWGTQRISSSSAVQGSATDLDFTYDFEGTDGTQGQGVDIYIVDTGVRVTHGVFGGRATQGFSADKTDNTDGDGHGTHVAGTAAGAVFGVASGANIIAVKVLNAQGTGPLSDSVAGIDWVVDQHNQRKSQPGFVGSIMSMSWGVGSVSSSVDSVIKAASAAGIHISVAAGNSGADACNSSPSDNGGTNSAVVSVGSIDIDDGISTFSNTGKCTDIYAPGKDVISAWNTADNVINTLSGTSMACPHVTGVMAYMMARDAQLAADPAALKSALLSAGLKGALTGNTEAGDQKILVSNGETRTVKKAKRTVTSNIATWAKELVKTTEIKRGDLKFALKSRKASLRY